VNVVPLFGDVLNVIVLLWLFRIASVMERPNPVPLSSVLVVKKGLKMYFFIEGFIPDPLAVTVSLM